MSEQEEFFEKVQRTLRLADQANARESQEEDHTIGDTQNCKPLSEIPFAIGMAILTIVTAIISVGSSTFNDKLMFGCFAAICLLVCAYKLDKITRFLRGKPSQKERNM